MQGAEKLEVLGLRGLKGTHWNLSPAKLYEAVLARGEGRVADGGALVVETGAFTGRAAQDKFIVQEPGSNDNIDWGSVNRPIDPQKFDALYDRVTDYLQGREVFVQDLLAGADDRYRMPIRVVTEKAWHSLFAHNMFVRIENPADLASHTPEYTVVHAPDFLADPERDGTRSGTFVMMHPGRKLIVIGGTHYAGEIKKSIFSTLNYVLPLQGVMSMHCSANVGDAGDAAVFFGLSGTGKTTLSADPPVT